MKKSCLKTWPSSEDCTRGEDRRERAKKKTKKEDVGSTYGARGKEDQLRGAEEMSTEPGQMVPSSLEPALVQSTQRRSFYYSFNIPLGVKCLVAPSSLTVSR